MGDPLMSHTQLTNLLTDHTPFKCLSQELFHKKFPCQSQSQDLWTDPFHTQWKRSSRPPLPSHMNVLLTDQCHTPSPELSKDQLINLTMSQFHKKFRSHTQLTRLLRDLFHTPLKELLFKLLMSLFQLQLKFLNHTLLKFQFQWNKFKSVKFHTLLNVSLKNPFQFQFHVLSQ